eukprot:jgi/Undpi1/10944/HiC_scaffold_3.g01470.m1
MLSILLTLSDVEVLAFGPPATEGWAQFPRHPAKHFDVFIKAQAIVMAYGTEAASDIFTARRGLQEEIHAIQGCLEELTDHRPARLDPHTADVEELISEAIYTNLKDFLGVLRDVAEMLQQRHAFLAPANGSGQPPKTPRFEQLSCLVGRNHI